MEVYLLSMFLSALAFGILLSLREDFRLLFPVLGHQEQDILGGILLSVSFGWYLCFLYSSLTAWYMPRPEPLCEFGSTYSLICLDENMRSFSNADR